MTILYTPNKKLNNFLNELKHYIENLQIVRKQRNPSSTKFNIGKLMEQIAYLCFKSLKGVTNIASYQSAGPQIDLLVTGDIHIGYLANLLYMESNCRGILLEAKGTDKKVGDKEFARLCCLLDHNFSQTVG